MIVIVGVVVMVLLVIEFLKFIIESVVDCLWFFFFFLFEIKWLVSLMSRIRGLKVDKYSRFRGGGGIVCK